ncbi:MAG: hypothetical protein U0V48_06320 [Anaerolineales bacterium]
MTTPLRFHRRVPRNDNPFFDVKTGAWSIWWLDGHWLGRLDVAVVRQIRKGVGTFIAEDTWEGKPLRVRFLWTQSQDGSHRIGSKPSRSTPGATWETNWVMDFTRSE